jgi:hypothetical protein
MNICSFQGRKIGMNGRLVGVVAATFVVVVIAIITFGGKTTPPTTPPSAVTNANPIAAELAAMEKRLEAALKPPPAKPAEPVAPPPPKQESPTLEELRRKVAELAEKLGALAQAPAAAPAVAPPAPPPVSPATPPAVVPPSADDGGIVKIPPSMARACQAIKPGRTYPFYDGYYFQCCDGSTGTVVRPDGHPGIGSCTQRVAVQ